MNTVAMMNLSIFRAPIFAVYYCTYVSDTTIYYNLQYPTVATYLYREFCNLKLAKLAIFVKLARLLVASYTAVL